jgi:hypothetical protein
VSGTRFLAQAAARRITSALSRGTTTMSARLSSNVSFRIGENQKKSRLFIRSDPASSRIGMSHKS